MKLFHKGQSLVEVVVAVGAMTVLLIALLALVSLSLRNSRLAKDRARAVALSQEGVELMRAYRDYDWQGFKGISGNFNLPDNWVVEDGLGQACNLANESLKIEDFFWRCVILGNSLNTVEVEVNVYWKEGAQTFTTNQITQISLWER